MPAVAPIITANEVKPQPIPVKAERATCSCKRTSSLDKRKMKVFLEPGSRPQSPVITDRLHFGRDFEQKTCSNWRHGVPPADGFRFMKCAYWFIALAFCAATAVAQTSETKLRTNEVDSQANSLRSQTQPLTPKSTMPTQHKTSMPLTFPRATQNTNAELSHLEHQNINASHTNATPAPKPPKAAKSPPSSPPIDAKYQKPFVGRNVHGASNSRYSGNRINGYSQSH